MGCRARAGFTAVEAVAAAATVAAMAVFLVLVGGNQRRLARLGDDVAHMKEIGAGLAQYQMDNGDLFCTFSWRAHQTYQTQYPDLNGATSDVSAAGNQLVYLLRTRGQLPQMPRLDGTFVNPLYSTLVLAAYLDRPLPWLSSVSSGDRFRLMWATNLPCFYAHCIQCQPAPVNGGERWPFSSSYTAGVAFYDSSPTGQRISQQGNGYNLYNIPSFVTLAAAQLSSVSFPSQKVVYSPQNAWHFGTRQPFCTHDQARMPLLMVDGSAPVLSAANSNPGRDPNNPSNFATLWYNPTTACWDSPPVAPAGDSVQGRFRWTKNGIAGRDFGGPESP